MDSVLTNVNWTAVIVGAVAAFALGSLWYSPKMFGAIWMKGIGITEPNKDSMAHAMISQAVATFLLSWLVGISATLNSLHMAVLIALTCGVLIKSNGLWSNKGMGAIKVEAGFVLAMVVVMVLVHAIL